MALKDDMQKSFDALDSLQNALKAAMDEWDHREAALAAAQLAVDAQKKVVADLRTQRDAASAAMQTAIEQYRRSL